MTNIEIEKLIKKGEDYAKTIDELAKVKIKYENMWGFIGGICRWSKMAGDMLKKYGTNLYKVKNLLSQNPADTNMLVFIGKIMTWKTREIYLRKLKKFVLLINHDLIEKIDKRPKENTIFYNDEDGIYTQIGDIIKRYKITKKRKKIFTTLLESRIPLSGDKLLTDLNYKNNTPQILSKEIKEINRLVRLKLDLKNDVIIRDNGGYQLNRLIYNFD